MSLSFTLCKAVLSGVARHKPSEKQERYEGEWMADVHLHPNRGWALIRDRGKLSPEETEHLRTCSSCNFWLARFSDLARKAGFPIAFEIPPLEKKADADDKGE